MAKEQDHLRPLDSLNSGARIPAIRLTRNNPKAAALMSKLVVDQRSPNQQDILQQQGAGINTPGLRSIANDSMQNVNDAETVRQLLADTDLAKEILVSVILSPKDMMGVEIGYQSELTHWTIPHEVNSAMTNAVRKYFEEVYKIKPRLPKMLEDSLFERGSYPVAVLPENALDDLIHNNGGVSTESLVLAVKNITRKNGNVKALGFLGPNDAELEARAAANSTASNTYTQNIGLALEHLLTQESNTEWSDEIKLPYQYLDNKIVKNAVHHTRTTVTDNLHVLKMPALSQKAREIRTKQIMGRNAALSTESITRTFNSVNPPEPRMHGKSVIRNVFHKSNTAQVAIKEVKTQDKLKRRSIGMPLEIHFPSEAVIPVHVPNQPAKQIGFFILLDPEGNPINRGQGTNHYRELGMSLQNNSFASSMIQRAGLAMGDNVEQSMRAGGYATMGKMYGQMMERELMQRLRNGLVGGNVSIAGSEDIYSMMLSREMANQQTQILYIPTEYMTYVAFDYHTNGTGKSLLDNTKIIDSMQAMMLVGTVMGALRNSIGRTHVDIELDEHTPDPWKAVETMLGEIHRVNSAGFPLGTIDPLDIKDGLIRSQFEFGISGHPKLPNMKVDFTEKNSNYVRPDPDIMEDLRKRRLMAFYLTPEQVDAASGADFATSVANNSTLLSKRAMILQGIFVEQVSAHLRKHAINSADLIEQLIDIINGSFSDIMKEFKENEDIEMFNGEAVTKSDLEDDPIVKGQFIRELVEDFVGGFNMTLPEPDNTKLDNLEELYKKQSELVDEALKAWISDDMLNAAIVGDEMAGHVSVVFAQIKAYLLRAWQIKHGLLPEMAKLTAVDEEGEIELDIAEISAIHNAAMMKNILTMVTANKKQKEKSAKDLEKAGVAEGDPYASSTDDDSSGGGDDSSMDDFGLDMDGLDGDGEDDAVPEGDTPEKPEETDVNIGDDKPDVEDANPEEGDKLEGDGSL